MRIELAELRRVTDQILAHLEQSTGDTVDVERDFYWSIPGSAKYDKYDEPTEIDVGQLSEDWDRLMLISQGKMPAVSAAAAWLGEILLALSEHTGSSEHGASP